MSLVDALATLTPMSALITSGMIVSPSLLTIPFLYNLPPAHSTTVFSGLYWRGAATMIPLALFNGASFAYLAYAKPRYRTVYGIAAVASMLHPFWTRVVMAPTNTALLSIAESSLQQEKVSAKEVEALLSRWLKLNNVRAFTALVGGVLGMWALLN